MRLDDKKGLTKEETTAFEEYKKASEEANKKSSEDIYNPKIVGVWFEKRYARKYPLSEVGCDVIGFELNEHGERGIEQYYDDELTGTSGREYGYFDAELNGLVACDKIIVPMLAEFFALEGLSQLVNTIKIVKTNYNPSIDIEGILFTMFDGRLNVANEVVKEVEKYFPNKIFETKIPRNVRISEAPSHGKPVMYYDKSSKGAEYYELLGHELLHEKPEPVKKKKGLFSRKR